MRVGLRKFWPLAVLCGHTSVSCCPDTGVIRVTNCQVVHAVHDWQASWGRCHGPVPMHCRPPKRPYAGGSPTPGSPPHTRVASPHPGRLPTPNHIPIQTRSSKKKPDFNPARDLQPWCLSIISHLTSHHCMAEFVTIAGASVGLADLQSPIVPDCLGAAEWHA